MTEFKKQITIEGLVNLRTDQAEARLRELDQKLSPALGGGVTGSGTPSGRAVQTLQGRFGEDFSFLQNRRAINALIRQEHQTVRDLTEQYERLKRSKADDAVQQREAVSQQITHHRQLAQAMRSVQVVGEDRERAMGLVPGGRMGDGHRTMSGMHPMMQAMAMQGFATVPGGQTLGGGLMRMMRSPLLMVPAALAGGSLLAYHVANKFSAPAEQIEMQYLDTARRLGVVDPSQSAVYRDSFSRFGQPGRVDDQFYRMGYSHSDVARTFSAYGISGIRQGHGTTERALLSQMAFARRFGFGQSPEMIAGMGRQAAIWGVDPAQQGELWRHMGGVATQGQVGGIDAHDTLKGMFRLLGRIADNTGQLTPERLEAAMVAGMISSRGGRVFGGERGMERWGTMLEGFTNPRTLEGRMMMHHAIMQGFGGDIPDAQALGLSGARAGAYEGLMPHDRLNWITENLLTLPDRQQGEIFRRIGANAPPELKMALFQQISGAGTVSQAVEDAAKLDEMAPGGNDPFESLATLHGEDRREILRKLRQAMIHTSGGARTDNLISDPERAQVATTVMEEQVSAAVSHATLGMRTAIKEGVAEGSAAAITEIIDKGEEVAKALRFLASHIFDLINAISWSEGAALPKKNNLDPAVSP